MNGPNEPGWARCSKPGDFSEYKALLVALYNLAGGPKALDLGCGEAHVTKDLECDYVDLVLRPTAPGKTMQFDIREAPKKLAKFHYNLLIMTDVIEHLTCPDGFDLLDGMEKICGATVIFTPVGPWRIKPDSTHVDEHKSAWWPEAFWLKGWEVIEFPRYHRFEGGEELGAFFSWQFRDRITPSAEEVCNRANLSL